MTREGDIIDGKWKLGPMLAYEGKAGCVNHRCRRVMGEPGCRGYHCPTCDEPVSMMGHDCPKAPA